MNKKLFGRGGVEEEKVQDPFWRINEWFPDIDSKKKEKFLLFHKELLKFNKAINLISVGTMINADMIHFADSILCHRLIMAKEKGFSSKVYDFGSGNGFPGLIFSVLSPQIQFILVDQDQRKLEFLKHIVAILKLENITLVNSSVDRFPEKSIKIAISRGMASLTKSLLSTRKLFSKGGIYYHMKTETWSNEVASLPSQLCSFWHPDAIGEYRLPNSEIRRFLIKADKIND